MLIQTPTRVRVELNGIHAGDVFYHEGEYYMKTDQKSLNELVARNQEEGDLHNRECVNLMNGKMKTFLNKTYVQALTKAKILTD